MMAVEGACCVDRGEYWTEENTGTATVVGPPTAVRGRGADVPSLPLPVEGRPCGHIADATVAAAGLLRAVLRAAATPGIFTAGSVVGRGWPRTGCRRWTAPLTPRECVAHV